MQHRPDSPCIRAAGGHCRADGRRYQRFGRQNLRSKSALVSIPKWPEPGMPARDKALRFCDAGQRFFVARGLTKGRQRGSSTAQIGGGLTVCSSCRLTIVTIIPRSISGVTSTGPTANDLLCTLPSMSSILPFSLVGVMILYSAAALYKRNAITLGATTDYASAYGAFSTF